MFTDSFPYCCRIAMALHKKGTKVPISLRSHRKISTNKLVQTELSSASMVFNSLPHSSSIQYIDPEGSKTERRQAVHRVQYEQN